MNEVMESLRKELRNTRIMNGILTVLLVCVLLAGIIGGMAVYRYTTNLQPLAEKASEMDFDALNETVKSLNVSLNEVDWEKLSDQLSGLDVEALNEKITQLDVEALNEKITQLDVEALNEKVAELDVNALNETLAGLDTKELSKALENLNKAVETMEEFSEAIKSFWGKFGVN